METEIKTPIEIINMVEPNGELLTTEMAIEAMQIYHDQFKKHEIKTAGEPEKYPLVRAFLLKKYPTSQYFDCPVPKEYYEVMQEYADQFKVREEVIKKAYIAGVEDCFVPLMVKTTIKMKIKLEELYANFKTANPSLFAEDKGVDWDALLKRCMEGYCGITADMRHFIVWLSNQPEFQKKGAEK